MGSGIKLGLPLVAVMRNGCCSSPPALAPSRTITCSAASSSIFNSLKASSVGSSFTASTVTKIVLVTVALSPAVLKTPSTPPSATVTTISAIPLSFGTGVNFKLPVELGLAYSISGLGIKLVESLSAVTKRTCDSPPPAVTCDNPITCSAASSFKVILLKAPSVGGSLTPCTVNVTVASTELPNPSVTE